ncbi:Iron-uptake system permease protein FeuB [Oligella ureolytica]|uniref:Iron chelate uptake ABC transporter family permease subunit n=1 Tax=Oligella ureolytica TaxID=90244 RepID=A0A378XGG3_9BURK|nr:iron chelate uptake ABC transporter family permease subunit [Oligella ureolytica]QPT39599.1 iron chelate uptake ABC transporter family permease subunit [Oligella ureolytica]SUA56856.1 Iron-uptake system permease protein FeuB [Oligella ureolytica]
MKWRILAIIVFIALIIISLFVGVSDISFALLIEDPVAREVFFASRIPRTASVILTGMSMANAGLIMQMLMHNRFVEPSMTGTTQAATLGLLLVTLLMPHSTVFIKMLIACAAAIIGLAGFMSIVRVLPHTAKLLAPLVGIIYGGVLGAVATFVAYEYDMMQYLVAWFIGDFSSVLVGRYELLWITAALCALAYFFSNQFTIAGLGKEISTNLGLNHNMITSIGLLIVALISAIVVVTVGAIPFIGLVVPNIVSRIMGDNVRQALPWNMLSGGALVLACDIGSRLINYPYEIPVGTIIGIVGTALFLYLLYVRPRRHRKHHAHA